MKIILVQDVDNLGSKGDVLTVKDGYGRNYLIPRQMALIANKSNLAQNEEMMRQSVRKREGNRNAQLALAEQLKSVKLTIAVKTGEDDRIFGTVTTQNIAELLTEKGINIDRKKISLSEDIKTLGEFKATVNLVADIKPEVTFWVVKAED